MSDELLLLHRMQLCVDNAKGEHRAATQSAASGRRIQAVVTGHAVVVGVNIAGTIRSQEGEVK